MTTATVYRPATAETIKIATRSRWPVDIYCPRCGKHFALDPIKLFCDEPGCESDHLIVKEKILKGDLNG